MALGRTPVEKTVEVVCIRLSCPAALSRRCQGSGGRNSIDRRVTGDASPYGVVLAILLAGRPSKRLIVLLGVRRTAARPHSPPKTTPRQVQPDWSTASRRGLTSSALSKRKVSVASRLLSSPRWIRRWVEMVLLGPRVYRDEILSVGGLPTRLTSHPSWRARTSWSSWSRRMRMRTARDSWDWMKKGRQAGSASRHSATRSASSGAPSRMT